MDDIMLKRLRRTKIVITLGPSTDYKNNLEKAIVAGANVVRLNFSHGNVTDHILRAQKVREISKRLSQHIAILGDLQGPKIRISTFKEGKVLLNSGDTFLLDPNLEDGKGNQNTVGVNYTDIHKELKIDDILILDDGRIKLKVLDILGSKVYTTVIVGGLLYSNKGINKLGGGLSIKTLTEKDKSDIITAAKIGVDYLAVSFPRTGKDLNYARNLARNAGSHAKIVSKVECAEAVATDESINDIILTSDVIMIARGDLGIEIGDHKLIGIQKKLIQRARTLNKAVITATQMMESMVVNPMPTRAEVMDVANAVLDGTDAVMLSSETAIGNYPIETISTMAKVCLGAEKITSINISKSILNKQFENIDEAIAISAMYTANHLKRVKAIVALTKSNKMSLMMSRISSNLPIFTVSHREHILNLTSLYRGVNPIFINKEENNSVSSIIKLLKSRNLLESGDIAIITYNNIVSVVETNNISHSCLIC